ncbi:hypothetical protein BX666DRAFT_1981299 [Dichotomocladium elegans]|nr:hypothetical protein BX666DRAFT_1981299 [Dichotomocladium elegans]
MLKGLVFLVVLQHLMCSKPSQMSASPARKASGNPPMDIVLEVGMLHHPLYYKATLSILDSRSRRECRRIFCHQMQVSLLYPTTSMADILSATLQFTTARVLENVASYPLGTWICSCFSASHNPNDNLIQLNSMRTQD